MTTPAIAPEDSRRLVLEQLQRQTELLERLVHLVEQRPMAAPGYEASLASFAQFDWRSIGAAIAETDTDGVSLVTWRGFLFRRRSADNKFAPAIWFSRSCGKDEAGNNRYERLITFKQVNEIEPLPPKVKQQAA